MHELLKLVTCGSVDDGKSTLIGHLMYNIRAVFTDQQDELEQIKKMPSVRTKLTIRCFLTGLKPKESRG